MSRQLPSCSSSQRDTLTVAIAALAAQPPVHDPAPPVRRIFGKQAGIECVVPRRAKFHLDVVRIGWAILQPFQQVERYILLRLEELGPSGVEPHLRSDVGFPDYFPMQKTYAKCHAGREVLQCDSARRDYVDCSNACLK